MFQTIEISKEVPLCGRYSEEFTYITYKIFGEEVFYPFRSQEEKNISKSIENSLNNVAKYKK